MVKAWEEIKTGDRVVITSNKKFGTKGIISFFKNQGLLCQIVGKGPEGLRLIECEKTTDQHLEPVVNPKPVSFEYRGTTYTANIGDSLFSRTSLDEGTRFLLDTLLEIEVDFNDKEVADFGAGWGAISLILAHEFPRARITGYEKDEASVQAAEENLKKYRTAKLERADLANTHSPALRAKQASFDYIVANPPFHATGKERREIFRNAYELLKPSGKIFFVTEHSFTRRFEETATEFFKVIQKKKNEDYAVTEAQKVLIQRF